MSQTVSRVNDTVGEIFVAALMLDSRGYLIDSVSPNKQIEILKSYAENNSVHNSFYTYFGFRDSYRLPLVYPYSINSIDELNYGQIYDERNVDNILNDNDSAIQLQLYDITHFAFDKNMIIAETGVRFEEDKENGYFIFNFNTQESEHFESKDEMFDKARELNYQGADTLMTLVQYNYILR